MDKKEQFERLKSLIDTITDRYGISDSDTRRYFFDDGDDEEVGEASDLAYELFMTDRGGVDHDNVFAASTYGLSVFPGESDSFGWLSGCVRLKDEPTAPIVVFG